MSSQNQPRKSFVIWMTIIAFLAMLPGTLAQTETRRPPQGTNTPKVLIFKSKGVPHVPRASLPDAPPPPAPLSAADKSQIVASLNIPGLTAPGSVYVRLSPRKNGVAGKAFLTFRYTYGVYGEHQLTSLASPGKVVTIHLRPEAAGRLYLIDCAVGSGRVAGSYQIWRKGGSSYSFKLLQTIESVPDARVQHLIFVLETVNGWWYEFDIRRDSAWYFYSCEVTSL